MRFQDIQGHDETKQLLRQMADTGRIPHAILLHGESGLGKMQLARAFAQYVCCSRRHDGDSCGVCPDCIQNRSLNHPDIHYVFPTVKPKGAKSVVSTDWMDAWRKMLADHPWMQPEAWQNLMNAGNSQAVIPVSESEEIAHVASLSSYSSDYKIFIVWLPEKMNAETANKLLKLLEEPYPDTIFIFVSNAADRLLPTIYSRLQRLEVKRLSDADLERWLLGRGYDESAARHLTRLAQGRPGVAEGLASISSESKEFSALFRDSMRNAYALRPGELKRLAETFSEMGREKCIRLFDYFAAQTRENFIYNIHNPDLLCMTPEEMDFSRRFAPFIHAGNVEGIADAFNKAKSGIAQNANSKLICFNTLLKLMIELRRPRPAN